MTALLELHGVDASYGPGQVLHGVNLEVDEGGMVALLGANGAGKTTTLRAICNMGVRTRGEIRFGGKRIDGRATEDIVRLGIGHVPEGRGTFLGLTVEENLRLGAIRRSDSGIAGDMTRVFGYFPVLRERLHQQAGTLSGGEQQMLAIARALMIRPRLLLLDEPSLGLSPRLAREIFGVIARLNAEGVTILLVEQNARLALEFASRGYVMESGTIALAGEAKALLGDARVREAYLGEPAAS